MARSTRPSKGHSKQLLKIDDLSKAQVKTLIESAYLKLKKGRITPSKSKALPVGLIFAESSTRTRVSFERAARSLGMEPYLLESFSSSLSKGEDLSDTVLNLQALGINAFVVRTTSTEELLALRALGVSVLNAGDGVGEHPSQALLDLLCLYAKFGASWPKLLKQKLCIVGNLSHSRVVNSWIALGKLLGLSIELVSPKAWRPSLLEDFRWSEDLEQGLEEATVVMALRVQRERLGTGSTADLHDYVSSYQITPKLLAGRPLMHPGPINWGVELAPELREYANSLILDQVRCGYYLRATLLEHFILGR
ncbi:MAG TPA: aspartate carbamoyltransferase [Bdellovibrionota bacterium]|jgi:aspartate carbamoyltransferase catalytic subunit|nr:aspartate carbamoyltransferase [Bdellovibrionota bacterium]